MAPRIPGRWRRALIFGVLAVAAVPAGVDAHAELLRAIPADGETVTEPVTVISGHYSQDLGGNSRLVIKDATGATVATGAIDPDDARQMVARPPTPLTEGTFTVESTSVSEEDGDIDRVTWTFTVAVPASSSPSASAEPPLTTEPSASPSPAGSPSPSASLAPGGSTSGTSDVLLPIIAALAIVAIGAGFLLSRSRRP
jgi:methionine-rich copper-binding protein CopC